MAKAPAKAATARKTSSKAASAAAAIAAEDKAEVRVKQPHGSISAVMSLPPPTGQPIRPPTKGYR